MERPEIDPELAEMEAAHQHHAHVALEQKASMVDRLLQTVGLKRKATPPRPNPSPKSHRDKRGANPSRWERRARARIGQDPDPRKQPHARLGRMKPKPSLMILEANHKAEVQRFLRRLKVERCIEECPEMRLVTQFGTVLALSTASQENINLVRGLGPAKRRKVYEYLTSKGVPVSWRP